MIENVGAVCGNLDVSPLGVELSKDNCKVLAEVITTHKLKNGDVLIEEGKTDEYLYIIVSGQLEVTRDVGGGEHISLSILKKGSLAGEMGFVDGRAHSATLAAMGDTQVYSLSRSSFEALIEHHPVLVYQVMRSIICSVHSTMTRMNQQFVELNNYISKAHGRY